MPRRILVFEDNPSLQTLLRLFFTKRGFEVQVEDDAVDAVADVARFQPALIIMDLIMPGKDGLQACVELRQSGVKAPIVMLTSKNLAEDRDRCLAAGANAYILKPFDPKTLDQVLTPLLAA